MNRTIVGLDIGRSTVKIVAAWGDQRREILFPSAVTPAIRLTDETEAARAAAETVLVGTTPYFFGDTALIQSLEEGSGSLRDDWIKSAQHSALFLGALKKLGAASVPGLEGALIVVGLPAALYASQKETLSAELAKLAPTAEIRVQPQSLGPYYQVLFTADDHETGGFDADNNSWAVIEIGQYTTDYSLLLTGRPVQNAFGSCDGMRVAAENLQRELHTKGIHDVSMSEATRLLETKRLRDFGKTMDVSSWVAAAVAPLTMTIVDKATQLIGRQARNLDGVLVAGGGAPAVIEELTKVWPHAKLTENARYAVADGFCRYGMALTLLRASDRVQSADGGAKVAKKATAEA